MTVAWLSPISKVMGSPFRADTFGIIWASGRFGFGVEISVSVLIIFQKPMTEFSKDRSDLTYPPLLPISWSLLFLSQPNSYISKSSPLMISIDLSMEVLNLLPSRCHRFMRSTSAARRRILVSIFSQSLHFWPTGTVCIISFIPHVSPILYSRLQCCRK